MEKSISIIMADDKEKFRAAIARDLKNYNIETIAVAIDGVELLKKLEVHTPDVILLDLRMAGMDGNNTMKWLSKNHPKTKVIIFSSFDDQELINDYADRGVKGYLSKSDIAGIGEVADAIRYVHNGGKYFYGQPMENPVFTPRQREIIMLLGANKNREEIATELGITVWGVDKQVSKIKVKLGVTEKDLISTIIDRGLNYFGRRET